MFFGFEGLWVLLVLQVFQSYVAVDGAKESDFVELACSHNPIINFRTGVQVESKHTIHKRSDSPPIRIHVEFSRGIDDLSAQNASLVKDTLLPAAVEFLSERISVRRPLTSPLLLYRDCNDGRTYRGDSDSHQFCWDECLSSSYCGGFRIPEDHLQACYECRENDHTCRKKSSAPAGTGMPNTDFVLYVQVSSSLPCLSADTTAHASYCQLEAVLDRPIAGHINICPNALSTDEADKKILLTTVKHEIIHALGFSSSLFAFYRDDMGQPLTPRLVNGLPPFNKELMLYQWSDRVIREVRRYDWETRSGPVIHTVQMMVTPKVKEEARHHFNCPSLEGIELENNGGAGTMFSHFEKRLLENEAMTGTHTHDRQFSRFTLAALEDTGWYHVNYDLADKLSWGKGLGCKFAKKSCKSWIDSKTKTGVSLSPFCDTVQSTLFNFTCDSERTSLAMCNLKKYEEDLPVEYQYFDSLPGVADDQLSKYGGTSFLADYCPFNQQFSYTTTIGVHKSSTCYLSSNNLDDGDNVAAEYYGPGSICVNHQIPWIQEKCINYDRQLTWGSGCYQHFCSTQGLKIVVEGVNYLCTREGESIDISVQSNKYRHQGTILCPACEDFCDNCPTKSVSAASKDDGNKGECPRLAEDAVGICISECFSGSDCGGGQKRCNDGDEGECPRLVKDAVGICIAECFTDSECGGGEKCCSNGCGRMCMAAVKTYNEDIPCGVPSLSSCSVQWIWAFYLALVLFTR